MISVTAQTSMVHCGPSSGRELLSKTRGDEGCQHWEREPSIDDDDWNPKVVELPPPAPAASRKGRDGWWTEPPRPRRAPKVIPVVQLPTRDPFGGMFNWHDE